MSFGERLKKIRTERGLRQEDIGKIVHVGKSTVSQWENNIHTPDLETVAKIARALNVSVEQFIDDAPPQLLGRTDYRTTSTPVAHKIITPPHIDDELWTEEELMEIERFKNFILSKRKESVHPIHHMAFTTQKTPPATRPTKKPR
ncbi:MAG: helix-turn-helix domain-containing protein [Dethiobacter sp.]|nr:helix-turn-helix domain-containing protein [Dethiobacter sp.]